MAKTIHRKATRILGGDDHGAKRCEILDADPMYRENVRGLFRRAASGKLPPSAVHSIQHSLIMASLRRAGFNLKLSELIARA